jgi:hypothetical protein
VITPRVRRLLGILCVAALPTGCAAPQSPAPTDPRVAIAPGAAALAVGEPRVSLAADGRMQVAVYLQNPGGADVPVRHLTDWLDAAGRPIATLQSRPRFMSVPRFGSAIIDVEAPSRQARDFRMRIDIDAP